MPNIENEVNMFKTAMDVRIENVGQAEDVIFTKISRGVLNHTIRRYFVYFS